MSLVIYIVKNYFKKIIKVRFARIVLFMIILFLFTAAFPGLISKQDPTYQNYNRVMCPPSPENILGTDSLGRDVFSRIVYGARISLLVGVVSVSIAAITGVSLGLIAGYFRGKIEGIIMSFSDGLWSIPSIVLALALTFVLGPSIINAMIAIGIVYMPSFIRLTRAQTLHIKEQEYTQAAYALGQKDMNIIIHHILPNIMAPIYVHASLNLSHAILVEATLSFLGVGVRPPTPSWGLMLKTGYRYMTYSPGLSIFPGFAIFLTVLAFNLFGDILRRVLDPELS